MSLLLEGQTDEAKEITKQQLSLGNREMLNIRVTSDCFLSISHTIDVITVPFNQNATNLTISRSYCCVFTCSDRRVADGKRNYTEAVKDLQG